MPSPLAVRAVRDGFPRVTRLGSQLASGTPAARGAGTCLCDSAESLELPLGRLHRRSVAIVLQLPTQTRLLRGRGEYLHDPDLGGVLRIRTHGGRQATEWLLVEEAWEGTIRSGQAVGCDYLVCLQPVLASSAAEGT